MEELRYAPLKRDIGGLPTVSGLLIHGVMIVDESRGELV